jgi:hypothetical protein
VELTNTHGCIKKCVNCKHSIKIPFSGDIVGKIMGYINNERERCIYKYAMVNMGLMGYGHPSHHGNPNILNILGIPSVV